MDSLSREAQRWVILDSKKKEPPPRYREEYRGVQRRGPRGGYIGFN